MLGKFREYGEGLVNYFLYGPRTKIMFVGRDGRTVPVDDEILKKLQESKNKTPFPTEFARQVTPLYQLTGVFPDEERKKELSDKAILLKIYKTPSL